MSVPQPAGRGTHSDGFIGVSVPGSNTLMFGSSKARQNRSSDAHMRSSSAAEGRRVGGEAMLGYQRWKSHGVCMPKGWLFASN